MSPSILTLLEKEIFPSLLNEDSTSYITFRKLELYLSLVLLRQWLAESCSQWMFDIHVRQWQFPDACMRQRVQWSGVPDHTPLYFYLLFQQKDIKPIL